MKKKARHSDRQARTRIATLREVSGRAFTVIELLVSIAAIAIVTVGLAAIFDAVGKTVQGGRRASVLSQYATMVEDKLRQDLASIDPNSFLMIRQQFVDRDGDGTLDPASGGSDYVELYPNQPPAQQRPRRIDEMVFFCRGDFASMRPPIASERIARGHEARVYYGHGAKMTPNFAQGTPEGDDYLEPTAGFRARPTNATMAQLGFGENKYASEWTLLRHVTVLQQPRNTSTDLPDLTAYGLNVTPGSPLARQVSDKNGQIALQPAADNIFRRLTHAAPFPGDLLATEYLWMANDNEPWPSFEAGTVDVATTDLSEIRAIVVGAPDTPAASSSPANAVNAMGGIGNGSIRLSDWRRGRRFTTPPNPLALDSLELMHEWMSEAFPTQSIQPATGPIELGVFDVDIIPDPPGQRIRYEAQAEGMRETLEETPTSPAEALRTAYERASQVMLTAHNFVPRCSEFIVEWSFGRINPQTNELIWHGPPRDGVPASQLCFYPFADARYPNGDPDLRLEEGKTFVFEYQDNNTPPQTHQEQRFYPFTDRLIYGASPSRTQTPSAVTSYFGYVDPMFDPANPIMDDPATSVNETGGITGKSVSLGLVECPRPKLIRVTMSLADPRDPSKEETFQFVLDVPQTRSK